MALVLVACTGKPVETPKAAAPEPTPSSEPVAAAATTTTSGDRPAGQLVCRTEKTNGAAMELFVDWDSEEVRGVIRETAVTGLVHDRRVRVEREGKLIVADDLREQDLVVHAAVVAERDGKKLMKVDDAWSPCR